VLMTKYAYISVLHSKETLIGEIKIMLIDKRVDARAKAGKFLKGQRGGDILVECGRRLQVCRWSASAVRPGASTASFCRRCARRLSCARLGTS
jgi:hypothetical protein